MTASQLKYLYYKHNPNGHCFDRKTMSFFGDTMKNFGVRDAGMVAIDCMNDTKEVDSVILHRKRPVKCGLHGDMAIFRKDTGQIIFSYI